MDSWGWASGEPMGVRWKGTPSMWSFELREEKPWGEGLLYMGGSGAGQEDAAGERP